MLKTNNSNTHRNWKCWNIRYYETAIRASQLGLKAAIIEKDKLGGVCLNIGCIPTKALLKSAEVASITAHLADYGLNLDGTITPDFAAVVKRSRGVADKMNKGVAFLMKKNKIDVIMGKATLLGDGKIRVEPSETMDGETVGETLEVSAQHIVIATGARARELPSLPIDGQKIIHLGPGYPKGNWGPGVWTPDSSGTPFEGFQWRNRSSGAFARQCSNSSSSASGTSSSVI